MACGVTRGVTCGEQSDKLEETVRDCHSQLGGLRQRLSLVMEGPDHRTCVPSAGDPGPDKTQWSELEIRDQGGYDW